MVMQLYPPASTGNVVGPASAVNGNLAAFDGTTGELLEDSGIATSQVATSQTAATAVARLALTGLARGARVYQTDNGFWYELTNAAAPSDAASWQGIPKKYVALLTQSGTDAPVPTVLENSLGGTVVWTRDDIGSYRGTLTDAFPDGRTFGLITSNNDSTADSIGWSLQAKRTTDSRFYVHGFTEVAGVMDVSDNIQASLQVLVYPAA